MHRDGGGAIFEGILLLVGLVGEFSLLANGHEPGSELYGSGIGKHRRNVFELNAALREIRNVPDRVFDLRRRRWVPRHGVRRVRSSSSPSFRSFFAASLRRYFGSAARARE